MNRQLKNLFMVLLFCVVGALPVFAHIPNHRLFFRNDKRAPLTTLKFFFLGAGNNRDGHARTGLAEIVSKLIATYSDKHGYTAELDALGTDFNIHSSHRYHAISISALSRHFETSVRIISDLMESMTFSESALQEARKGMRTSYRKSVRNDTHRLITNFALVESWGIQRWRSLRALERLELDEIQEYYTGLLTADVVFLKAVSDLDSTEVEASVRPLMENRRTGGFFRLPSENKIGGLPGRTAFVFENYSHLKNVYCYWLIPCGTVGEENHVPNLITGALGSGGASGLLYGYFREELELVYGTSCRYRSMNDVRFIEITADPQIANSEELIAKMSEFILGLADNDRFWSEIAELRENSDYVRASLWKEWTPRSRLDNEVNRAISNSPVRKGGFKSVTDNEVRSFLDEFFIPENMIMIFLGPKEHTIEILESKWPDMTIHVQTVTSTIE